MCGHVQESCSLWVSCIWDRCQQLLWGSRSLPVLIGRNDTEPITDVVLLEELLRQVLKISVRSTAMIELSTASLLLISAGQVQASNTSKQALVNTLKMPATMQCGSRAHLFDMGISEVTVTFVLSFVTDTTSPSTPASQQQPHQWLRTKECCSMQVYGLQVLQSDCGSRRSLCNDSMSPETNLSCCPP